jgi:short-subunit dehydrogenase
MKLAGCRTLLTGAGSGIGRSLAIILAARGARLALVGRHAGRLDATLRAIRTNGGEACAIVHDLGDPGAHGRLADAAAASLGGIDLLVNNAGLSSFGEFVGESPVAIEDLVCTNITAPMLLTRAVLPAMLAAGRGRIVNVGSILGSIGFPHFAAYCASKFALRGFSEALRRELAGSGIGVTYVAPRTTRTAINPELVYELSADGGGAVDEPDAVAALIADAVAAERDELYIGGPEKLAVRLNALWPRLVGRALAGQAAAARQRLRGKKR